jgi:hypothetical protein
MGTQELHERKKTIEAMIHIYCKNKHKTDGVLCPECAELCECAKMRLDACPFQEKKSHAASV